MRRNSGILILIVLLAVALLGFRYVQSNRAVMAYNQNNLIRFHVVANSDREMDQVLKLQVRDVIVEAMTGEFAGVDSIGEARKIAVEDLEYIKGLAEGEIRKRGLEYPVKVYHDRFPFPTRTYNNLTLPAGEYEAIKVILGEGAGANWWCVLFPPLCFMSGEKQELARDENRGYQKVGRADPIVDDVVQIEYRLKIVDWIQKRR